MRGAAARTFLVERMALGALALLLAWPMPAADAAAEKPPRRAIIKVTGYGFLANRQLARTLRTLELGGKKPDFVGATFVEDSMLILAARVKRDGYLKPEITARLELENGSQIVASQADLMEDGLPRPLRITRVTFHIRRGVLYHFSSLTFSGLASIPEKRARSYFLETEVLLRLKGTRVYTPDRLRRGVSSLADVLDRQGYRDARVEAGEVQVDERTGATRVHITVNEGVKYWIREVEERFYLEGATNALEKRTVSINRPYSRVWVQDYTQSLKTNLFTQGYPDTTVELRELGREPAPEAMNLRMQAEVKTGPKVRIASVDFAGAQRTRRWLLSRRVKVERGDLLNPIQTEQGRSRLAELGIFDTVDLSYEPAEEHSRRVLYTVKEGKRLTLNLLAGYGSYELLRGGAEAELFNIWGLAHSARLKLVQSFKSTSGELTYTVPEWVRNDIDLFVQGFGLRREEVSFTREEYGAGLGAHRYFRNSATDVSARYNYQVLNALDLFPQVASEGLTNPAVGSIRFDLKHDRRDNPLYPRQGYKVFGTVELASEYLLGDANYTRFEISPSWHHRLGRGAYLSAGLSHGAVISFGDPAKNLPFNKRFFPGGNNSLRGYQEGEASPRNQAGDYVGAETYVLGTVELEQALTPNWSLVVFSDSLGFAHSIENYPFDTGLFSVGVGIRWKTIIGPVRLEYGYNLNPRPGDPSGTLHFALGFPF